jgi:hypothetical protein
VLVVFQETLQPQQVPLDVLRVFDLFLQVLQKLEQVVGWKVGGDQFSRNNWNTLIDLVNHLFFVQLESHNKCAQIVFYFDLCDDVIDSDCLIDFVRIESVILQKA